MANNYLHDVATGLLLVCFGAVWSISRGFREGTSKATASLYLALYRDVTRIAKGALIWILVAGVPRTIYYKKLEWAVAAGDSQVPAIIIKHVITFSIVGAGAYWWMKFGAKAKAVRASMAEGG